ncbi:MAG: hypothetical protein AB1454_05505 [Candidatus Auribacterota bacterium]
MKRLLITLFVLILSETAHAEFITVNISGVIDNVNDPFNVLEGAVQVGDAFNGSYTYDTDQIPLTHIPNQSSYVYSTPPNGIIVNINGLVFKTKTTNVDLLIQIGNDRFSQDYYIVQSVDCEPLSDDIQLIDSIRWQLSDTSMAALSSQYLTDEAPDLSVWPFSQLDISGWPNANSTENFGLFGTVNSAEVSMPMIPEPLSLVLLGTAITGLLRKRGIICL